jgi:uncharacterized repeat protein (TIGR03803 family)
MTPDGDLNTLAEFFQGNGEEPLSGVILATDGNFYGTTSEGGTAAQGTVFKVSSTGVLTSLYSFCPQFDCSDGAMPYAGLVQGADGSFYGTTYKGGVYGDGVVFKISSSGKLTTLYSFCSQFQSTCLDGEFPQGTLIQAGNGDLYGTTTSGGPLNDGTVFRITTSGKLTTLHSFNYMDGVNPQGALFQGKDGNLYGTTFSGGTRNNGTVFRLTPAGSLTSIYSFCAQQFCADGAGPTGGVIQASDGNFYGTTSLGGSTNNGVIYEITQTGNVTILHTFYTQGYPNCADGFASQASLLQGTDGILYGTTTIGGTSDDGTVFSLNAGLSPYVRALPGSGAVGSEIGILGTDLRGALGVTFNGIAAKFNVVSSSLILTHIPVGATTGIIKVTLPSGTLVGNVPFYVLP